jgi:hypothetical protein
MPVIKNAAVHLTFVLTLRAASAASVADITLEVFVVQPTSSIVGAPVAAGHVTYPGARSHQDLVRHWDKNHIPHKELALMYFLCV